MANGKIISQKGEIKMKPKMILFDYGGTLLYEPDFCPSAGNQAIYSYISKNPNHVSLQEFSDYLLLLFEEIRALRGERIEMHEHIFLRYVLEHFNMKLSIPIEKAEEIIWNGISKGCMTPNADKMLAVLRENHIRTGIISNLCWSSKALTKRLKQFFPKHHFEFIITSSDYIFRKPDIHIFDIAIRKSGLKPEEIWYCGNDVEVDIFGAYQANLFPVYYDDRTIPSRFYEKNDSFSIEFPHLRIHSWEELTKEIFYE